MKKLSIENIQFIDRYLSHEIIFTDIRAEMVDHVASAIEQKMTDGDSRTFYYIFKDYMIINKELLYKTNRKFLRSIDYKAGKRLLKNVFSFKGILIFLVVFFSFNILENYLQPQQFLKVIKNSPMVILFIIGFIYLISIKRRKERFSAIERLGLYFLFIHQFSYIFFMLQNKDYSFTNENLLLLTLTLIATFLITLVLMFLFTAVQYKKEYSLKFKNV